MFRRKFKNIFDCLSNFKDKASRIVFMGLKYKNEQFRILYFITVLVFSVPQKYFLIV